jgi:hypothetical protein
VGKTRDTYSVAGASIRANPSGVLSGATVTRDGANVVSLNRLTNDGDILTLTKDGGTVGSIGVDAFDNCTVASSRELILSSDRTVSRSYVLGDGGTSNGVFYPTTDNDSDLGQSGKRWNDLYLGGGVYLGGTGAANKLDDYEEGTFLPFTGIGSGYTGEATENARYTKIGRLVNINLRFNWTGTDGSSNAATFPMPFAQGSAQNGNVGTTGAIFYEGTALRSGAALIAHMGEDSSDLQIFSGAGGTFSPLTRANLNGSYDFVISYTYYTNA